MRDEGSGERRAEEANTPQTLSLSNSFTLSIETCFASFSIALSRGSEIVAFYAEPSSNRQAEMLLPEIENLLAGAKLGYADIGALAVAVGPGSFTGIRIGIAAALGVRLAAGIPIIPVTTLEALAASEPSSKVAACIDARRNEAYYQEFGPALASLTSPSLLPVSSLPSLSAGTVAAGSGAKFLNPEAHSRLPDARHVALAALYKAPAEIIEPFYIRPPDARIPDK